jgi:Flp pilus assembly protein TadD
MQAFVSFRAIVNPAPSTPGCHSRVAMRRTGLLAALIAQTVLMADLRAQAAPVADTASVRAESLLAAKQYAEAASAFEALTRTYPQRARYWTRLGTSLQLAGRADDAVAA